MDYREELANVLHSQAMGCLARGLICGLLALFVAAGYIPPLLIGVGLAAYAAVNWVSCFDKAKRRDEVEGRRERRRIV